MRASCLAAAGRGGRGERERFREGVKKSSAVGEKPLPVEAQRGRREEKNQGGSGACLAFVSRGKKKKGKPKSFHPGANRLSATFRDRSWPKKRSERGCLFPSPPKKGTAEGAAPI